MFCNELIRLIKIYLIKKRISELKARKVELINQRNKIKHILKLAKENTRKLKEMKDRLKKGDV